MQQDHTTSAFSGNSPSPPTIAADEIDHSPDDIPSPAQVRKLSDAAQSKLKRTACVLCRKRKLKCDGARPACGTCGRLGHECKYDEIRKKSGPKRGYVKALEARLAQVETMLKTQDEPYNPNAAEHFGFNNRDLSSIGMADPADLSTLDHPELMRLNALPNTNPHRVQPSEAIPHTDNGAPTFDMISMGLEEPLPIQDITEELNQLYFIKVNASLPIVHRARYFSSMNLPPHMRPPVCLRYAMWALAASSSDKFDSLQAIFYQRARKYLDIDEMRGFGQSILTLAHCQAWMLVAMYEFKNMFFPRAWMSTGRAIRLTQMLGLHRLDGTGLDVKMTVPPPRDWTEREERRRTFWLVYWADRCASIGTGWPMSFEEKDILTNLPAPDENFQNSQPTRTITLAEALQAIDKDFSSTSGIVLMATLFGRNLTHLHRPEPDDNEEDLNGKFWTRHRSIDAILLNIKLTLPDHLRIPLGISDPNVIFLNMCLHASAICLHQAAIFKAEKHHMPLNVAGESKMRCIAAASEIATIMRTVSHMDLIQMNPFTAFCLYVAARVFVQFLRARPSEQQVSNSLQFLLTAMHAMTKKNPLTESFIAQLELDMESAGIPNPQKQRGLDKIKARGVPEYAASEPSSQMKNERCGYGLSARSPISPVASAHPTNNNHGATTPAVTLSMRKGGPSFTERPSPAIGTRGIPFGHTHDGGIFPWQPRDENGEPIGDPMDLTPEGSATAYVEQPNGQTRGDTVMTPPRSEDHESPGTQGVKSRQSSMAQGQSQSYSQQPDLSQEQQRQQQHYQPTSTSYGFPGQDGASGETTNMEDFSQFLQMTPGLSNLQLPAGWENMQFPSLTPGASGPEAEEFQRMMQDMSSWEGGEPLIGDQWYTNGPG